MTWTYLLLAWVQAVRILRRKVYSELFEAIMAASGQSICYVLDKWVEEGNDLDRPLVGSIIVNLRKRPMYGKALQLSEWLEENNLFDTTEQDYASRVDLIAKVCGLKKAKDYADNIPVPFRGEAICNTLLANYVIDGNLAWTEELFNRMRAQLPLTAFACNQMILLYKRLDKKKIPNILSLMGKENVKPSLLTYKLLIDTKAHSNDVAGMEQLINNMKAEGIEPDIETHIMLAQHYACLGLRDKAEAVLDGIEGGNLKTGCGAHKALLLLYASVGKAAEVSRIWKECELNPKVNECMAAIEAWGKLGKIEEAEAVFEMMLQRWKRLSLRHYSALLQVYANHKLLNKGKEFVKRMGDSGCWIGPLTWDALVRFYLAAGELERADSILQVVQENRMKPLFNSYMVLMDQYARRGDVHNAEKLFHRMRQCGYSRRLRPYEVLIKAYINAKTPAYGFQERMKADDIFPNRSFAAPLAKADVFSKTAVTDMLD